MAETVAQGALFKPHRNHYLFSDYYLTHRVRQRPEWSATDADAALAALRALWRGFAPQTPNEAQTEKHWIQPVLDALGHAHSYEIQVALKTPLGTKKPDYIFFADDAARRTLPTQPVDEVALRGAFAVGDAKAFDRLLDRAETAGAARTISENPTLQIDTYIRYTGLSWGILTNGRLWRLYHKDTSQKLDVFYEVDLPALLDGGDVDAFKYFYLFFRRAAFLGAPAFLDVVLAESRDYEQGVSDRLKDQVYDALRALAQGFLDFPANHLQPTPQTLKAVYDNSLIVLYRLLFVLYAESRGLLPVGEHDAYTRSYSLHALKTRMAHDLRAGAPAVSSVDDVWHKLRSLWRVINNGDPHLGVPAYDGGLFDPTGHDFLEHHAVGDLALRAAIDLVARTLDRATGQREFVDYRDLEIRHLGSIYEGLLEYEVRYAEHPLTVRKEKGREVYAAAEPGGKADVPAGQVYLATSKGERKASGSYYTPDYIVQYIVEHAVGPILDGIAARYPDNPQAQVKAILALNVLDPAMGSGHFPVAVTDAIARRLVALGLPPQPSMGGEAELAYWRRRVAQSVVYGVDLNPLAVELAKLSLWLATVARDKPLSFLDHHLRCGNSLIGARMADMGLADAAPPIATQARKSKAARAKEDAQRAAGQMSMLDDGAFVGAMRAATTMVSDIETMPSDTLAGVQAQKDIWRQVSGEVTQKYRRLADVWTARQFGLDIGDNVWRALAQWTLHGSGFEVRSYREIIEQAEAIAGERRFFHWELEFPEVFFDQHGRALADESGFDAVVGNPPYVRQEQLSDLKPYFARAFPDTYHGMADLFVYFFNQGLRLLRQGGRLSYISSNSWLQTNFAEPLRRFVRTSTTLETLIDLGNNRTFAEAPDVCPSIFVIDNQPPESDHRFASVVFHRGEPPDLTPTKLKERAVHVWQHDQPDRGWQLEEDDGRRVTERLRKSGRPLMEVVDGKLYRGILTGLTDAFVVNTPTFQRLVAQDAASREALKPFLRGEDLRPWYQEDEGRWLILIPSGWTASRIGGKADEVRAWGEFNDRLPAIAEYLQPFRETAVKRQDKGEYWWELRSCAYYGAFEEHKIVWPDIAKIPRFSFAEPGVYLGNTGYIIPTQDAYLLGFLQSHAAWLSISKICLHNKFRGGLWEYRLIYQFLSRLPIPDAPPTEREAIGKLAMDITQRARARYALHRQVQRRIGADLGAPERSLNQKLTAWWDLEFPQFRGEIQKVFKHDIPLKQRDEWETWLAEQVGEHGRLTDEIVRLETDLNARVYALFDLTAAEIKIIEDSTKYRYGEV